MYVRVYREDSDYAYESDTSSSKSDGDSGDDEEPLVSSETFSSKANNTYMDTISSRRLNREAIAVFQSKYLGLKEQARNLKKNINYTVPESMAYIVEDNIKRITLPETLRFIAYNAAHNKLYLVNEKSIYIIMPSPESSDGLD